MARADWHTYQVLTKRSERMRDLLQTKLEFAARLPHIWWGVSVEDRKHGLPRVRHLQAAPAGLRMLSVEPLLEDLGELDLHGIGWVILGGESGPGARPLDPAWVVAVRDLCRADGTSRSSSSNGEASARASQGDSSKAGLGTKSRLGPSGPMPGLKERRG